MKLQTPSYPILLLHSLHRASFSMATAATHLLLLPNCSSSIRCLQTQTPSSLTLSRVPIRGNLSPILCTPLSASIVEENAVPPSSKGASIQAKAPIEDAENLPQRGCKACGREEVERGCNGEGRIQGGIAMVPGFGWWPIKAFRPCPGFVASGGRYRRRGQSMDEVAWGTSERKASMSSTDEVQ